MTYSEGTATSDQPFKYNGKELDQTHGLNWFDYEARMYNGYRFPTPDPLADKYPDLSPYVYCANNPVRFIDPDGQKIRIKYGNSTYDYNLLTNKVVITFTPDNYIGRVNNDLNRLRTGSSVLDEGIGEIEASKSIITIQEKVPVLIDGKKGYVEGKNFFGEKSNTENEALIQYEAENWIVGKGKDIRDPVIGIGHELGHAWDFIKGRRYTKVGDIKKDEKDKDKIYNMLIQEVTSMRFENEARYFLKVAKRKKYGGFDIIEDEEEDL